MCHDRCLRPAIIHSMHMYVYIYIYEKGNLWCPDFWHIIWWQICYIYDYMLYIYIYIYIIERELCIHHTYVYMCIYIYIYIPSMYRERYNDICIYIIIYTYTIEREREMPRHRTSARRTSSARGRTI